MTKPTSYLDQLFPKIGAEKFLTDYWPTRLYVERGPLERIAWLTGIYDLSSLEALFDWAHSTREGRFQADLPTYRDEVQHLQGLAAKDAEALYRAGMTLRFNIDSMKEVADYIAGMKRELALPPMAVCRNITYLSPKGEATSCHFDANANIIIQLIGSKRWTLAPNEHVAAPVERYTANHGRLAPSLADHVAELPRKMPRGARTIVLEPGSVLFVPRGYWHETHAVSPSLSLNFTSTEPTWATLVASALEHRLLRDPAWRGLASGFSTSDAARRKEALRELGERLSTLGDVLAELDPAAVVDHALRFHAERQKVTATTYRMAADARCQLGESGLRLRRSGRTERVQLAGGVRKIVEIALAQPAGATFTDEEMIGALPDLQPIAIRRALRFLVRLGAMELVSEPRAV